MDCPSLDVLHRTKTVLVVEDEISVRRFTVLCLQERGYNTVEAEDGRSGLSQFAGAAGKIDMILTDVNMPRMTGPEMAAHIWHLHPAAKILFMSGTVWPADLPNVDPLLVLRKPFTAEQLTTTVRNCLEFGSDDRCAEA